MLVRREDLRRVSTDTINGDLPLLPLLNAQDSGMSISRNPQC
jgi:hypothetical protein